MKKIMEKDGQSVKVDVQSGSVEVMAELGWKVVGDAEPDPEPEVEVVADALPAYLRTTAVLEAVLMETPDQPDVGTAEALIGSFEQVFGAKFTGEHEAYVRSKVKLPAEEVGTDPDYTDMTKAQIKELLDAKGVVYEDRDNKDKLVERLKASAK